MREIARPWIETPIKTEKVRSVLPKSVLIISKNDPYGASKENIEKFGLLKSRIVVLPNAGHITASVEPTILSEFQNLVQEG